MKNSSKQNNFNRLVQLMFEVGTLRKVSRSHRQTLLTDELSDNIASHTFRAIFIGYLLAKLEGVDPYKVVLMCLIHDFEEARCGDQNWVHKKYVKVFEKEIIKDQFMGLTKDDELFEIKKEYEERKTKEAKLAKDADLLDQILLLKEYSTNGNKEAQSWLDGKEQEKRIYSKTAKEFAKRISKSEISCWWENLWTADRR